jgi:hypothetical protein
MRPEGYAMAAEYFKWEPIKLATVIPAALFTIIAPGFTEEVSYLQHVAYNIEDVLMNNEWEENDYG